MKQSKIDSKTGLAFASALFLTVFLFALTVYSQTNDPVFKSNEHLVKNKKIELILGPSLLYPTGSFTGENNPRRLMVGYSFGVGYQHLRINRFEIISRLLYEKKGYKTKYTNVDADGNVSDVYNKQNLEYVSFSALPAIFLGKSQHSKLIAGAYFSLLTQDSFKQEVFLNGQYSFSYFAKNVKGRFDPYDYGVSLGACHTREINENIDIGLQLLGNLGLNNIVPPKFPGVVTKLYSLSLSVIMTYKY